MITYRSGCARAGWSPEPSARAESDTLDFYRTRLNARAASASKRSASLPGVECRAPLTPAFPDRRGPTAGRLLSTSSWPGHLRTAHALPPRGTRGRRRCRTIPFVVRRPCDARACWRPSASPESGSASRSPDGQQAAAGVKAADSIATESMLLWNEGVHLGAMTAGAARALPSFRSVSAAVSARTSASTGSLARSLLTPGAPRAQVPRKAAQPRGRCQMPPQVQRSSRGCRLPGQGDRVRPGGSERTDESDPGTISGRVGSLLGGGRRQRELVAYDKRSADSVQPDRWTDARQVDANSACRGGCSLRCGSATVGEHLRRLRIERLTAEFEQFA